MIFHKLFQINASFETNFLTCVFPTLNLLIKSVSSVVNDCIRFLFLWCLCLGLLDDDDDGIADSGVFCDVNDIGKVDDDDDDGNADSGVVADNAVDNGVDDIGVAFGLIRL